MSWQEAPHALQENDNSAATSGDTSQGIPRKLLAVDVPDTSLLGQVQVHYPTMPVPAIQLPRQEPISYDKSASTRRHVFFSGGF